MLVTERGDATVFRASEIDEASMCPRSLGYSRDGVLIALGEDGVPSATAELQRQYSWNIIGGLAMDDALSALSLDQIAGRKLYTGSALTDLFARRVDERHDEFRARGPIVGEDTRDEILHDGSRLVRIYEEELSPKIHPVGVQVETSMVIQGEVVVDGVIVRHEVRLVGHIDLVAEAVHPETGKTHRIIWDWKFTGKSASQMPASSYGRGWAYDMMHGDGSGHIGLVLLRRGLKSAKIETTDFFVTPAHHAQVRRQAITVARMYRERIFPLADVGSWKCSPKWCSWHAVCRGSATGPALIRGEEAV